jgi:hypothetical protein
MICQERIEVVARTTCCHGYRASARSLLVQVFCIPRSYGHPRARGQVYYSLWLCVCRTGCNRGVQCQVPSRRDCSRSRGLDERLSQPRVTTRRADNACVRTLISSADVPWLCDARWSWYSNVKRLNNNPRKSKQIKVERNDSMHKSRRFNWNFISSLASSLDFYQIKSQVSPYNGVRNIARALLRARITRSYRIVESRFDKLPSYSLWFLLLPSRFPFPSRLLHSLQ